MTLKNGIRFEQRYELLRFHWLDGPYASYLARDQLLQREVTMYWSYRDDDDEWFVMLARNRARLCDANLVPVYDLGVTNEGRPFFTERPYLWERAAPDIKNVDLEENDNAAGGALPRLIGYFLDACKAITFLHDNKFFHLDLHPEAILVAPTTREVFVVGGRYYEPPMFASGRRCGKFIAPEQAEPIERDEPAQERNSCASPSKAH